MSKFFGRKFKKATVGGLTKNPFFSFFKQKLSGGRKRPHTISGGFYFALTSCVLLGLLCFGSQGLAQLDSLKNNVFSNTFLGNSENTESDLFFSKGEAVAMETPDLKINDNSIYSISTPLALSTQTLGDIFGEPSQERKEVEDYEVQPGDTIDSVAAKFNITSATVLSANSFSKGATLKVGQNLTILPVSGVVHAVKSGDNISDIAKYYKSKSEDIVAFNERKSPDDLFVGDILIIPGGVMPARALPSISIQAKVADTFFINPAEGKITQRRHYFNGVDLANKCGTPIYAAAAGTVRRVVANGGYNQGKGNHVTIEHSNDVSTYYGHMQMISVSSGDQVNVGDRIGLMGKTGAATGCHVHFQVMGAENPLAKHQLGDVLQYK